MLKKENRSYLKIKEKKQAKAEDGRPINDIKI